MRLSRTKTTSSLAATVVLAAMVWLWAIGSQAQNEQIGARQAPVQPGEVTVLDELSKAFITVADKVRPAVVSIEVTQRAVEGRQGNRGGMPEFFGEDSPFGNQLPPELREFFGGRIPEEMPRLGVGSGVIINAEEGYILTNNHVVSEADEIRITLNDNREFTAEVVGADESTDIAVVQIEAENLTAAKLGDSSALRVGEIVMAVGSPFALGGTVTQGIVSAKERQTGIIREGYESFIQTDAAVNPGNSGGPLVNLRGEVVGINTAIATGTGAFAGVSFAVPIDLARSVVEDLIAEGKVTRGYLGIEIGPVDSAWARRLGMESPHGALVSSVVPDGPSAEAGLEPGDVIVELDGDPVRDYNRFRLNIGLIDPGQTVTLGIIRDGREREVRVTLDERPADLSAARNGQRGRSLRGDAQGEILEMENLGLTVQTLTSRVAERLDMAGREGVLITDVDPNGPAFRRAMRPQMVITRVEKTDVSNVEQFKTAVEDALGERESVLLWVLTERGTTTPVLIEPQQPSP